MKCLELNPKNLSCQIKQLHEYLESLKSNMSRKISLNNKINSLAVDFEADK